MKRIWLSTVLVLSTSGAMVLSAPLQHGFSVKEYDEFHEVLHPLQHEALPKGDFATIRARSGELIKHGKSIVKLGVPRNTSSERVGDFRKALDKFNKALAKFRTDAKTGSDEQLKVSYSAVHDSFETLADKLEK